MTRLSPRWISILIIASAALLIGGCSSSHKARYSNLNSNVPEEYCINGNLVSPAWVDKLIEYHEQGSTSEAPIDYNYDRNHKYLIFETSWGPVEGAAKYNAGHVPGAIHSNSDIYENGDPMWFLLPDNQVFEVMKNMGITADTTVIVYSDDPIFAARLWWILKYAGLEDVRYLDGGYENWIDDGFAGENTVNHPTTAAVDYTGPVNPDFIATVDYVAEHYTDTDNYLLADVRSKGEYKGSKPGYDYLLEKGRIPNAKWFYPVGGFGDRYYNTHNTLKPLDEVRSMWQEVELTDGAQANTFDKEVIFYCGAGYRSAGAFFYAYLMGYKNIRNFSNGWEGWSTTYTHDLSDDCTDGTNGKKHGAWPSNYCQKPSGRTIEP